MPLFQEIWSFRANSGAKWNEVHYSVSGSLAAAAGFVPSFRKRRTDLLHPTCTWTKVRITQVGDPSVHTLVNINEAGTWGSDDAPANPGEAAVINLSSVTRSGTRRLWMRGLPESAVQYQNITGRSFVRPDWGAKLTAFIQGISNATNSYAIKKKKVGQANGIIKTRVLKVDGSAGDGTSILTVKDNPLLIATDYIEIVRAEPKTLPGLKGPFKVLAANATTVTIQYTTPENQIVDSHTAMGSKLKYWEDATIDAASSGFNFGGVRKTKNDSTGSRGARSAQRIRN